MTQSIEDAFAALKVQYLEMSLLRAQQQFRNVIAHARCYLCGDYIDDQRWHLGETDEGQEIVHTDCYDKEEEEARKAAQYVGLGENSIFQELPFREAKEEEISYTRGIGLPEGPATSTAEAERTAREDAGLYSPENQGSCGDAGRHLHLRSPADDEGTRSGADLRTGGPVEIRVPMRVDRPTMRVRPALKAVVKHEVAMAMAMDMRSKEVREAQALHNISEAIRMYEKGTPHGSVE